MNEQGHKDNQWKPFSKPCGSILVLILLVLYLLGYLWVARIAIQVDSDLDLTSTFGPVPIYCNYSHQISGIILDSTTQKPIAGAEITLRGLGNPNARCVQSTTWTTDLNGYFNRDLKKSSEDRSLYLEVTIVADGYYTDKFQLHTLDHDFEWELNRKGE